MKLTFLSDIHIDHNQQYYNFDIRESIIETVNNECTDYFIIAGDISGSYEKTIEHIEFLQKHITAKILFVPGNHDVWTQSDSSWDGFNAMKNHDNCIVNQSFDLNHKYVAIGGFSWYDYSMAPREYKQLSAKNKITWIDHIYAKWQKSDIELSQEMMGNIEKLVLQNKDKEVILINHFVPYKEFIWYKENDINWNVCCGYFGIKDLGRLINKYNNIKIVNFGHTHRRFGMVEMNNKKLICQPLGYVFEFNNQNIKQEINDSLISIEL